MQKPKDDFDGYAIVRPDLIYWAPKEPGEMLEGVYAGSFQGSKHIRYILRGQGGQGFIIPNTLYIRGLFKDKIPEGMIVKIRFEGMRTTRRGTPIYDYTVGVRHAKDAKASSTKPEPI